ncbi:hypothetical protein tb265_48810 [Gemmatimonadetes bacterium T265]|nr:hypothetical protein tb265_48810 [Gemmatimonadetes bacterium T265]
MSRHCAAGLVAAVLAASPLRARADTFTFPFTYANSTFSVNLLFVDAQGNAHVLTGTIDPGFSGNFLITSSAAAALGLPVGDPATGSAVGGPVPLNRTNIPAANAGSIMGASASGPFNPKIQGAGKIIDMIVGAEDVLIGNKFLVESDPAGLGSEDLNAALGQGTLKNHAQALGLSNLSPSTQLQVVPIGAFNDDPFGQAFAVSTAVSFNAVTTAAPSVLSTGVSTTLLSSSLAASLGLTTSGATVTVTNELGTFTVPAATVGLTVFPELGGMAMTVGVLPDALNPDGINVLGNDVLSAFSETRINAATGTLSVTATPEPGALLTTGAGALGVALIRRRIHRGVRAGTAV